MGLPRAGIEAAVVRAWRRGDAHAAPAASGVIRRPHGRPHLLLTLIIFCSGFLASSVADAAARVTTGSASGRVCIPARLSQGPVGGVDRVRGMTCDEAITIAQLFELSSYGLHATDYGGGTYHFWYGYVKPRYLHGRPAAHRRYWTCRANRSASKISCQAAGASFRFTPNGVVSRECGSTAFDDPVDLLSTDAGDWLQSGDFTCAGMQTRAHAFYAGGLDGHNGARRHYNAYGGWTCTTSSQHVTHPDISGYYLFTCLGEPFARSALPEEIDFDLEPQIVTVSCQQVLCTETYPTENGDYGDNSQYASAGLTLESPSPGTQGPVPTAGAYNWLALCTWQDQGSPDNGQTENYLCGYAG